MSNREGTAYPSPPSSPENNLASATSGGSLESPSIRASTNHRSTPTNNTGLESPFETPNERTRNVSGVQRRNQVTGDGLAFEATDNYYKEQYESQMQICMDTIADLEKENSRLKQAPGDDYLTGLESHLESLSTTNDQLLSRNETLHRSEQAYRTKCESLSLEVNQLQQKQLINNTTSFGNTIQKYESQDRELREELKFAREENGELYNRCTILEQENDEIKSREGEDGNVTERLKLVKLSKYATLSEEDCLSIRMDLIRLTDQLDEEIELRMLKEGSMLFDQAELSNEIDVKSQETEELKEIIRSQQEEIEALRNGEDYHDQSSKPQEDDNYLALPLASSFNDELENRFDAVTKELEDTKKQLDSEKAYSKALTEYKEKLGQTALRNTSSDLDEKTQRLDTLNSDLENKVRELQTQLGALQAQLHSNAIFEDTADPRGLLQVIQDVFQKCGKLVVLSNEILDVSHQAKEEVISNIERVQEASEELVSSQKELSAKQWALVSDESKSLEFIERHGSNDQAESRMVVAEWKSTMDHILDGMDRLFINLYEGVTDDDEDLLWPSSPAPKIPMKAKTKDDPRIIGISDTAPPIGTRAWTEMICGGKTYWTEVALKDRSLWIKISGPFWWSYIIQLLMFILIPSIVLAWWCIMTASAERELWINANSITIKKYWDTAVWGAERDLLWRILYGLGYV